MPFLNRYNKAGNYRYVCSQKVGDSIYSIGTGPTGSVVIKLDINGNVVWDKANDFDESLSFYKITTCSNNSDIIVTAQSTSTEKISLIRINSVGTIVWKKQFNGVFDFNLYDTKDHNPLIEIGNDNYVLAFTENASNPSIGYTVVIKINGNGVIVTQKSFQSPSCFFRLNGLTKGNNKIGLYGMITTGSSYSAAIIEMDLNLNGFIKFVENASSSETMHLIYKNDHYFVHCNEDANDDIEPFFTEFTVTGSVVTPILQKHYTGEQIDNLKYNSDAIYIETYSRLFSVISKISYGLEVLWTKRFTYPNFQYAFGVLDDVKTNEIILTNGRNTEDYDTNPVIGSLDLELTSCKTTIVTTAWLGNKSILFHIADRDFVLTDFDAELGVLANPVLATLSDSVAIICPDLVDPPCIKDLDLCKIYDTLLLSFVKCIEDVKKKNPNYVENPSVFDMCFEKFLESILKLDKDNPNLHLDQILHFQINAIKEFIDALSGIVTSELYLNAESAVQFILEYLSQLGNCNCEDSFNATDYSMLQSGHLYLQAAGSTGDDSSKGIHLRWALKEALAQHLPKANYAFSTANFNKPNDYVKIYRAKYEKFQVTLNFANPPSQLNETGNAKNWLYAISGKVFHIHFRDIAKYNQVRAVTNPMSDSLGFIKDYGNTLIEIETKTELSFKVAPKFEVDGLATSIKLELLSVLENKITAPKAASLRKTYTVVQINQAKLVSENIRSMRFTSTDSYVSSVTYDFYSDFVSETQKANGWEYQGRFALTTQSNVAFQRLEPQTDCLENWLRYNDDAFVNAENYHTKWNGGDLADLEKIAHSVERYITLSESADNPRAIEIFPLEDVNDVAACNLQDPDYDPEHPEEAEYYPYETDPTINPDAMGFELSYLDVLHMGSLDYHVARMIGLGTLDLSEETFEGSYIYLAEYITYADLHDGLGARPVQHLYCSLPTSLQDQRFCLPIDLKVPVVGAYFNTGYGNTEVDEGEDEDDEPINDPSGENFEGIELTADGYSPDGKTRYYTLYAEPIPEEQFNAPFYYTVHEFISANHTYPVFAGLEHRPGETTDIGIPWNKPELSYDDEYFNIDSTVDVQLTNQTVELLIPENGESLYTHAVKNSGFLTYSSYGINWFSRAVSSSILHDVETKLRPENTLLPPSNVTATLIQRENPLLLTTALEQTLYNANSHQDKTLVRLTFDYNISQELIDYHQKIDDEIIPGYAETDDDKELWAEELLIYFRNQLPDSIAGKITVSTDHSNILLANIETGPYTYASTGETVIPFIPPGMGANFVGSIMIVHDVQYVIHEVDTSSTYPKFVVFKSNEGGAIAELESFVDRNATLTLPDVNSLFMIVENMQTETSWGEPNPSPFAIHIDHTDVHREEGIIIKNIDCSTETHVQKFRGIYENAVIDKVFEKVDDDNDGYYDILDDNNNSDPDDDIYVRRHLGLYKVTFPGIPLPQHTQFTLNYNETPQIAAIIDTHSVEFYNGIVRLHVLSDIDGPRKVFKVIRTENIGTTDDLILYIQDPNFPAYPEDLLSYKGKLMSEDDAVTSIEQKTNYYPGYKVYLYEDPSFGLTENNVLPQGEDDVRYTIFSMRSKDEPLEFEYDNEEPFYSKLSVPTIMFAQAVVEPVRPQLPIGGMYATRPDFFGKASYTFQTTYGEPSGEPHKPYSVQFNRASDIQFLSAIYDNTAYGYVLPTVENPERIPIQNTVQRVMKEMFMDGEEEFFVNRWNDLLSFDYPSGQFETFEERTLPLPDNPQFIESINNFIDAHNDFYNLIGPDALPHLNTQFPEEIDYYNLNTVVIPAGLNNAELQFNHFVREVLLSCFVPLTEIPVIYNFVKNQATYFPNYKPLPKKQVIRDRNGNLLKLDYNPNSELDMAPMMKRIDPALPDEKYKSQFTDFGLDGASNAKYFYAVREINNQMKVSDYSPILGPISLVNTEPPIAPEIVKIIPVLENRALSVNPTIQLQINSYPVSRKIAKITVYRADNPIDALAVRTMKQVRVFDLEVEGLLGERQWIVNDDFSDLPEVPFGDPLYYRLTVSRKIRYNDINLDAVVEYAPSEASKLVITNITENYNPESPVLQYTAGVYDANTDSALNHITFSWNKTTYKGNYSLYKMNSQGNWVEILRLMADRVINGDYHLYNWDDDGNWVNTIHPEVLTTFDDNIYLPLEVTNLLTSMLETKDAEGKAIYHHFKVIAQNTAGMLSKKENILTLYDANSYHSDNGISSEIDPNGMIVEGNFIVRDTNDNQ